MKENNKELGTRCEKMAQNYLLEKGYSLVTNNYRTRNGEIDIICSKDEFLIFVEVKHIGKTGLESLYKSVDFNKRKKIVYMANQFLYEHKEFQNSLIRFDVFGIDADKNIIEHIENAFGESAIL